MILGRIRSALRVRKASRLYSAGRFEEALKELEAAAEARPGLPLYRQYRGMLELKLGRADDAEQDLAAAETAGGDPFVLSLALGAADVLRKRPESARTRFEQAFASFPVAYETRYHVGLARFMAGDEDGARAEFARLLCRDDEALFKRLVQALRAGNARDRGGKRR